MKKHLLIGSALLAAISVYPQSAKRQPVNVKPVNMAERIAKKFAMSTIDADGQSSQQVAQPSQQVASDNLRPAGTSSFATSWNPFTGSMNIYSSIISGSAPLNYNEDLNAVSYVHRKSDSYPVTPTPASSGAASGAMVAMISQNFGATWDSTCLYSNDSYWGRYPHGAIYNPAGNVCMDQAYIVGCGPVTPQAGGWVGNFYASKQLGIGNYNAAASTTPNAMQVQLHANTGNNKVDFIRYDFTTTDDGKMRTAGIACANISGSGPAFGYRGTKIMTGSFNSGVFVWSTDSIIPNALLNADGTKEMSSTPYMAWNEAGTVGYVVHIGASPNRTLNNVGWQPIVHKTTNSGISWAQVNSIDFNLPNMAPVIDHVLSPNSNTNVTIPLFDSGEGIGVTVDKNDNLHIASLILGTFSPDPDSLGFTFSFNNADGEEYNYRHTPGLRPYLYDFVGNGIATWSVVVVDSLSSEAPGATADRGGFDTNPWLEGTDNTKASSDARIQLSRTADGNFVVFTFAESDTSVTSGPGFKWNELPNVKARLMNANTLTVSPVEVNITKPATGTNSNVASRAYFHYASRKCVVGQTVAIGPNGPAIGLPITVTRNQNFDPLAPVVHRYATAALNFGATPLVDMNLPLKPACSTETVIGGGGETAIQENNLSSANSSFLYPNPTEGKTILAMNMMNNSTVNVVVSNMVGQQIKSISVATQMGENNIGIDVSDLAKGVYMVTVKIDNASSTKKLIVE